MNGRERLAAAMRGDPVDRVPIWLREGFEPYKNLPAEDDFKNAWKHDTVYQDMLSYVEPYIDFFVPWDIGALNRFLMIPPNAVNRNAEQREGDNLVIEGYIQTPARNLPFKTETKRNNNNSWMTLHPVKSVKDLQAVAEIPFAVDTHGIDNAVQTFQKALKVAGDRGLPVFNLSSPIVIISGLMDLQLFLELSVTEKPYFHKLLETITERQLDVLRYALSKGNYETTMNIGGSEQCTPPLMAPSAFDEYVVPYETPLIEECRKHGIPTNIHCHGKIRHALKCMVSMGADSTDPVEPFPAGDLSFREAREISQGDITLRGNIEYNEFTYMTPVQMRVRVKELLADGSKRVIISTSAGPNTSINQTIADNYRALIDAALEYGN
ncbi:MAG: hypothetical protein HN368_20180 [Spirochaetales bacterium]|jgi:uroporphyrinogen-III decarboxylase|nr:hypothetical protein [Spirochaetales bacterium]